MNMTASDLIDKGEILVVDDTIANLQLLTDMLSAAGYKVRSAADGEMALHSVHIKPPDMILLDIMMPGMDGFEVCRQLKADENTRSIPVIFISALDDEQSKIKGFEIGAVDYINKPFHMEEVRVRVNTHLTLSRLQFDLKRQNERLLKEIAEHRQTEQALEQLNAELEEHVHQRTAQLTESQSLLAATQRLSRIGGWQWNIQTQTMEWTEETYRIHDLDPNEIQSGSPDHITRSLGCYEPEDQDILRKAFQKCVEEALPYDLEIPFTSVKGRRLYVRTMAHAVMEGDRVVKIIGNIVDITDKKQVESEKAQIEALNRQLQKAESLGRMASAIAHHFNNQLQVVMGNLEIAMDDPTQSAESMTSLNEAMKATRNATHVSKLMLTYRGQMPGILMTPLDLSEVCRQTLPMLQVTAPKGILIQTDIPASGPVVRSNTDQIQQVLTHLLTNAWESSDSDTKTIGLSIRMVSRSDIPLSHRFPIAWQPQHPSYACIEVADTGGGIASRDIEKLFDPFYTTKFTGRGLGLSVVLGIVSAHGGCITVNSEPGKGSVFRIFLPVQSETVAAPAETAVSAPIQTSGGTVLVVEDEGQVRQMVRIMLKRLSFEVIEARDGVEAVDVFQQHMDTIRCVICDLTMPRMNGWETIAALRRLSPDIPVILSSGYDEERVMADDHPETPQAFLGKPYQFKDLSATIQRVLDPASIVNRKAV